MCCFGVLATATQHFCEMDGRVITMQLGGAALGGAGCRVLGLGGAFGVLLPGALGGAGGGAGVFARLAVGCWCRCSFSLFRVYACVFFGGAPSKNMWLSWKTLMFMNFSLVIGIGGEGGGAHTGRVGPDQSHH